jgi:hypothetical protein
MPDVDTNDARRRGRLLTVLFWAGIGLAPLAGLLLLLGSGNGVLRVAAILTVLAVVSIGLSIALRPDPAAIRLRMEETLLEEIDMLRADVRNDIAAAARATHQSFGERLQSVQQMVDALRSQRAGYDAHAAVAHVVVPPPLPAAEPVPLARPAAPPTHGRASVNPGAARGMRHQADDQRSVPVGRANVPGGVFRHTETVQVTTRSTYVDEHAHNGDRARAYDPGYPAAGTDNAGPVWPAGRGRGGEPYEESWTDRKLRERYGYPPRQDEPGRGRDAERSGGRGDDRRGDDRRGDDLRGDDRRGDDLRGDDLRGDDRRGDDRRGDDLRGDDLRGDDLRGDDLRGDDRWGDSGQWPVVTPDPPGPAPAGRWDDPAPPPEVRSGSRWAAVRTDERGGRELQVGERRTARHADETGTEWRVEDRWAAVRRDEDRPGGHRAADRAPDAERRALPAAGAEPSWNDGWDEPVREPRGQAHRGGDRGHSGTPSRRIDFELSDERWQ